MLLVLMGYERASNIIKVIKGPKKCNLDGGSNGILSRTPHSLISVV